MTPGRPSPLPPDGRRLVIIALFDERGAVPDSTLHSIAGLREHADHLLAVVNGDLTEAARERLGGLADEVLVRENLGFDIGAQRAALEHLGDRLFDFDELLLTNDTWFGPIESFAPVFERMNAQPLHFWGMTEHGAEAEHPLTGGAPMPAHLQSFWIAARRELFSTPDWAAYWAALPPLKRYEDAVLQHEVRFTEHFTMAGFVGRCAFPSYAYPTPNASLFHADLLIEDGCPVLKKRTLFHGPWVLDRHAVIDRWTIEALERRGFPVDLIWSDLVRRVEPRVLHTNAGMLEPLPAEPDHYDHARPLRTLVAAHIFYPEMTDEMLERVEHLPGAFDLVITTPDAGRAASIRESLAGRAARGNIEVRVVTNAGRDQSAFLIGCRDLLAPGRYDLVVKIHSKRTVQDGFAVGRHFATQQFVNLLGSPGSVANLVALFQREPGLGLVFPPMIHIGYNTLGKAWWANREPVRGLCQRLGIRVPLDDGSPLAPFGSMFVARPEALRSMLDHPWRYEDFGDDSAGYRDGGLAHALERLPSYAAAELGFHTRTVADLDYLAVSTAQLDFLLEEFRRVTPGSDDADRIEFARAAGQLGPGRLRDFARLYLRLNHPGTGARIRRLLRPLIRLRSALARR